MKKAVLFEKLKDKKVRCKACNHKCVIGEGERGICGVRENKKGELYLLVYGKAVAFHVDPIEKKPLYHFLPGSKAVSLGTVGCNFSCKFCQNWEISQVVKTQDVDYGQDLEPSEIVDVAVKEDIPIIAYTYNEPGVWIEYAYDIAKESSQKGIKNVFVSGGYESEDSLKLIKPYLDGINIDLKSFSEDFYRKVCGARLKPVLDNIKKIYEFGIWMEITTLVISGKNDSDKELKEIAGFISGVDRNIPWHISGFYPCYKMIDIKSTSLESLVRAYDIGRKYLNYVYVGNVRDEERSNTYCSKCNELLIKRNGYFTTVENLKDGRCERCGEKIVGVWK
jgi:pyruvate formate lyase activating enzyme